MSAWRLCGAGAPGQRRSSDRAFSSVTRARPAVPSVGLGSTMLQLPCPESRTCKINPALGQRPSVDGNPCKSHTIEALGLLVDELMVHAVSDSVQQSDARDPGTYEVTLTYFLVITRHLFLRLMLAIPCLHALCISLSCIAALPV